MLKRLLIIAIAVTLAASILSAVITFVNYQNKKVEAAIQVVRRIAYARMLKAEEQGNLQQVRYYRHQYDNPATIVAEFGAEIILANKKSH